MEISTKLETEDVPDIISSLDEQYITDFKPFIERYFIKKDITEFNTEEQQLDTCIRIHNNGLCVVFLSDNHSIIKGNKLIKNINFKVSKSLDRTKNKFSGKRKKGAQLVKPDAVLCYIECEDGTTYPVHAGVHGRLLEINDKLIEDPQIITKHNNFSGYLCIILPDNKKNND